MLLPINVIMDSGLGSDEEQRRTRTKEQKQRHNEQILNGGAAHCFIDASALQDDDVTSTTVTVSENAEQRKTDERRQGALLFKSSIPQYSTMFQLAGPSSDPPDTPFNSIVHIEAAPEERYVVNGINGGREEEEERGCTEEVAKHSLGFYVDLNEVEVETSPTAEANSSAATKNIFSMVIDFEAPKKEMPSRLLRRRSRPSSSNKKNGEPAAKEVAGKNGGGGDGQSEEVSSLEEEKLSGKTIDKGVSPGNESDPPDLSEAVEKNSSKTEDEEEEEEEGPKVAFVRLSDLMKQNPRVEEICSDFSGGRMSRSIPESSWVESPLLMSRSAGYRIAPRPLEPDSTSLTDSTGSQTGASQRKLGTDLLRMFLEEIDTDTVLHVGSPPRSIKAHRCILISRCQYFAGTLRGRSLIIDGFSYEAVHFALCHIYSGASHVPDSISLVELASLADMLSLEGLKEVVAHALKSRHCHHFHSPCAGCLTGVLEVLPLSAAYGLDDLYQRCLRWITSHYLRVWPSRAFASLPKELRDKCYQQHVVHMCAATVLETNLSCDRLLASLPGLKWAEPVVQLGVQLVHNCQTYVGQHYGAVLPTLLKMEPWNYPRVEEIMLNSAKGLSLDQECSAYSRCNSMIEKHKADLSTTLVEIFEKIKSHFEKRLILKAGKLTKCPSWNKLDAKLKAHVKSLAKMDEGQMQRSFRNEPSRLPRMVSNRTGGTSSSESSRNSSPATSQAHASPSLRRSLLLAARAPQVPPSPSTVKRISTLTMPTAASAAKSAPARHIKPPVNMSTSLTKPRPATAPVNQRRSTYANKTHTQTVKKEPLRKESAVKVVADNKQRQVRRNNNTATKQQQVQINQTHVIVKNKIGGKQKEKEKAVVESTAAVMKSPCMQRSSTFLKEEPTVLTHPDQAEM